MIDRRRFIGTVAYGVAAAPLIGRAQTGTTVRRIGFLASGAPATPALLEEQYAPLRELGWIEGRNLIVERRYADRAELFRPLAEELVRLRVELIVTEGTDATLAAKSATNNIPIVIRSAGDPIRSGLVASLGRPGGNITGYAMIGPEVSTKGIAMLRELLPGLQRIGVLENSTNPYHRTVRKELEQACRSLGMHPIFVEVAAASELENALAEMVRRRAQALVVAGDNMFYDNRIELMRAALKHGLPIIVGGKILLEAGALISYGASLTELRRRGAAFIDKILRGAKPADLPIEQPTQFELGINLQTAKALGITVPQSPLLRADEVIQ
ncbi:MAG TPA: ABC transporter substrate-binding protein [Casimicrobiaceae bacterium]